MKTFGNRTFATTKDHDAEIRRTLTSFVGYTEEKDGNGLVIRRSAPDQILKRISPPDGRLMGVKAKIAARLITDGKHVLATEEEKAAYRKFNEESRKKALAEKEAKKLQVVVQLAQPAAPAPAPAGK